MKTALRLLLSIWVIVTVASLAGLVYIFPGYSLDSAFSEALREHPDPRGSFWFHWCVTFCLVGTGMTAWLYWTYHRHYGDFWKSK